MRALSDRLGAGDRISFRGHLPVEEHLPAMRELMLDAAVLCLPSMSELEGLAGMSCGEPLSGADPEEIGAALDRVLARDWDRVELRRRVVRAFEPQRAASAYANLICRLAAGQSRATPRMRGATG